MPAPLIVAAEPYFADRHVSIYHGNCQELLRALPSESVDMALTDPPYLVGYRGRWCSDWDPIKGDEDSGWVLPAFLEVWRLLKPDSLCLSFYGWPHADVFLGVWKLIGFKPVSHVVCVKNNIGLGYFSRSQHETAYLLAKGNPPPPESAIADVFTGERETSPCHPNQKPLGAISRMVSAYTSEDAVILDPFMGSGTTLVAARNMGRRAIGVEIEERYCEVAAKRLAQQMFDFEPESSCSEQEPLLLALSASEGRVT